MAIKPYYLKKYIPKNNVITDAKRMAENYVKTHTGLKGKVVDSDVYFKAIELLAPFSDDVSIANKIADYQNQALTLKAKKREAENSKVLFEYSLNEARQNITKEKYWDSAGLIKGLSEMYLRALNDYDTDIYMKMVEDVLVSGEAPESSIINFREDISRKALMFSELNNSYLNVNPKTNVPGPTNTEAYGVFVKTNPSTGSIVDIEIDMIGSVEDPRSGFNVTNTRYGGIPIYLNYAGRGSDRKAKIGPTNFTYDEGDKILNVDYGILTSHPFFKKAGKVGEELSKRLRGEKATPFGTVVEQADEFPLGEFAFDIFDIPTESVIKDGQGQYYFFDKNKALWPAESPDFLKMYLSDIGRDSSEVDDKAYSGHPDFIRQHLKADEEGHSRVINDKFFSGIISPRGGGSVPTAIPRAGEMAALPEKKGRVLGIQEPSPEFVGGGYQPSKISEKGRKIFRGTV